MKDEESSLVIAGITAEVEHLQSVKLDTEVATITVIRKQRDGRIVGFAKEEE